METLSVRDLLKDVHVRLLAGYSGDAVMRAAVLAEAALKTLAGRAPESKAMLGELIGELHKQLPPALVGDINWLNQRRIAAVHFTGQVRTELDGDGRRAADIADRLALLAKLTTELELAELRREAEWAASEPASTAVLRLDRAVQRKSLDDLLGLPRRVLVLMIHGEFGQGHDHFAQVTTWRLRAGPKGRWREVVVDWPSPSPSQGVRFGALVENLAHALAVKVELPAVDPMTPAGEAAWAAALEPILRAVDAMRERMLVRHALRWLGDGDDDLVERYVRMVWWPLASRHGERVVVGLDVRRVERAGLPLSRSWRTGRLEQATTRAIAQRLEQLELPREAMCAALAELDSVSASDLAEWLRAEAGRRKDAAEDEAAQLHATTRGGRFELVVERLVALNLDRK